MYWNIVVNIGLTVAATFVFSFDNLYNRLDVDNTDSDDDDVGILYFYLYNNKIIKELVAAAAVAAVSFIYLSWL